MLVSARSLFLVLSIWLVLFVVAYSGVIKKPSSSPTDSEAPMARYQQRDRKFRPSKFDSEIMQLSDDLSHMKRMQYTDSCRSSGMNCTRAEDCCSLQCLKRYKKCTYRLF
ncbi:uncharacterized protein LOC117791769 [Drosophila innubila]|uniref:uncharacterized protein LOC117791769 n=1 Tax=Drosophila innubila TaxID=198719 RepID=UPI00148DA5E7|nr:uncharacterized protein LOC117791769 [Drosophila innubila]